MDVGYILGAVIVVVIYYFVRRWDKRSHDLKMRRIQEQIKRREERSARGDQEDESEP